jgi:hypothetical protein
VCCAGRRAVQDNHVLVPGALLSLLLVGHNAVIGSMLQLLTTVHIRYYVCFLSWMPYLPGVFDFVLLVLVHFEFVHIF